MWPRQLEYLAKAGAAAFTGLESAAGTAAAGPQIGPSGPRIDDYAVAELNGGPRPMYRREDSD